MIKLIDSHAHYDDRRFDEEFEGGRDAALSLSRDAGVVGIINVATNLENIKTTIALADKYEDVFAAIGIHPEDCQSLDDDVSKVLSVVEDNVSHPKVVAIGEIGLDYYWKPYDKDKQIVYFESQIEMAKRLDLPVIVHCRDATGDAVEIVKRHKGVRGVFHSYSGSAETAAELLPLGWYFSFGGPLTYKNAHKVRDAASAVPLDRLLIETDCPYLPPVPHRGKINYSAYMLHTLGVMAEVKETDEETLAEILVENTKRLFGI
ncbi:MAG: TatD family hydrolase [Clostridia bacterium]|nr:TatD family hydrolase [Clostridia bacterium]